ncbi:hypothetical protein ABPG74_003220 [Tetrahymena malaccensis]
MEDYISLTHQQSTGVSQSLYDDGTEEMKYKCSLYKMKKQRVKINVDFVVTNKAIYNYQDENQILRIILTDITQIIVNRNGQEFMIAQGDNQEDLRYKFEQRDLLLSYLLQSYTDLAKNKLLMIIVDDKQLHPYQKQFKSKKRISKNSSKDQQNSLTNNEGFSSNQKQAFSKYYTNPNSDNCEKLLMNHLDYEEKFSVKRMDDLSVSSSPIIKSQVIQQSIQEDPLQTAFQIKERQYCLEDFVFYKILGQGAFGVVFLSIDKQTNEEVAVKMISKHEIEIKKQRDHTQTEKLILEHIKHPFLINVLGTFQDVKNIYFVMKVLKGGELFQHLKAQRFFAEERVKFYAAQMILALEHLHSFNIIYRDLKLENILLDEEGYLCLTDFGLAKILSETDTALTFCGTPEYLSPETIKGFGSSKASDWWSLGTLLYEMLFSMPPFYHKQHKQMFQKIVFEELQYNPNMQVSSQAKDLIGRLLCKDPRIRLGSCEGATELKNHPWFEDVDWDALYKRQVQAPFKPVTNQECWLGYFDQEFVSKPINNFFKQIYDFNDLDCYETFQYY